MLRSILLISALLTMSLSAQAGKLYRFVVDGRVVIKDSVPAELAPLGYEVLNAQGMVLRKVPRELTADEIAERDRLQAEKDAHQARIAKQKEQDKSLMRLYSGVADVDRALLRKTDEVDAQILIQKRRITDLQEKLAQAQQAAADTERRGRDVPDTLRQEIRLYQEAILSSEESILEKEVALQRLRAEYQAIRERLRVLSVYPAGTLPEDVDPARLP